MTRNALRTLLAATALAAGLTVASAASAAVVVVTETFDLTKANVTATSIVSNNNTGFSPTVNNVSPLSVSNGDSIDYKVSFLPGQGVNLTGTFGDFGLFEIALVSPSSNGFALTAGSTLSLFDTSGNLITTALSPAGASFGINGFTSTQSNIVGGTFGPIAIPITGTIGAVEFKDPNVSLTQTATLTSQVLSFTATSGGFQVVSVPVKGVPEPATWAMLVMGFGGLGAVLRRRRTLALA